MKWHKLGMIFDSSPENLPDGYISFAQSPQAIVFNDFIRIFFSTRCLDIHGKFLSYVCFVDFDKQLKHIINKSKGPVISLGELGCFDEHGIFPMNVLRDGADIKAYITGWTRRKSVPVDAAIGLAISTDNGISFNRISKGPVIAPSLYEPFLVGDGFVLKINNTYHMWYISGTRWITDKDGPQRVYKILHAVSKNGISWEKEGKHIINDIIGKDECQALPTVIEIQNKYHMFFCYRYATDFRQNPERAYRLGYASSNDGLNWERDDSNAPDPSNVGWDSEMLCYPNIFKCDDKIYLLYNGNEFGKHGFGAAMLESM